MQISKLWYIFGFIKKHYPENYASSFLKIFELFAREVSILLKKQGTF